MAAVLGVVSPHLDDAALSCAQLIAAHPGSHVVTVFAGGPASMRPLTTWDRLSGCFADGDDVIGARRREDERAAAVLGATCHHLDLWDRQYRSGAYGHHPIGDAELAAQITGQLAALAARLHVDAWVVPLGIGHGDHEAVGAACLALARRLDRPFYVYAELPYRRERPQAVAQAVRQVGAGGFYLRADGELRPGGSRRVKLSAIRCHRSQLQALGRRRVLRALVGPERLWRLAATYAPATKPSHLEWPS